MLGWFTHSITSLVRLLRLVRVFRWESVVFPGGALISLGFWDIPRAPEAYVTTDYH